MRLLIVVSRVACILLAASVALLADAAEVRPPDGGGGFDPGPTDAMSEAQWEAIQEILRENRAGLVAEGRLPAKSWAAPPELIFPLKQANGLDVNGYYGISGFVDQDASCPGSILDYNCGQRTYDTGACYNHRGVDYFLWPFAFLWMDNDQVEVISAADGTILHKEDGYHDRSCDWVSNPDWNVVFVEHADGSVAWYGHLKNGSLTAKGVGEAVAAGEYLGIVGSSGVSTAPHLHFELYDTLGNLQEPHYIPGQCNAMNSFSWWEEQRPYRDSKVNLLTVGDAPPAVNICPNTETPNIDVNFELGDTFYTATYYRDQLSAMQTEYSILRPDGTVWFDWSQTSGFDYNASWWWWNWTFGNSEPLGIWLFRAEFDGQVYDTPFRLGGKNPAGSVDTLRLGKSGGASSGTPGIVLEWEAGCLGTDTDYGVFEGELSDFTSHTRVVCTTGGLTTYAHTPAHEAAYYLVVAQNALREGSYGADSAGNERPAGTPVCKPQEAGLCPP